MDRPQLVSHLPSEVAHGCFQILAVTNKAVISLCITDVMWTQFSLGQGGTQERKCWAVCNMRAWLLPDQLQTWLPHDVLHEWSSCPPWWHSIHDAAILTGWDERSFQGES